MKFMYFGIKHSNIERELRNHTKKNTKTGTYLHYTIFENKQM